MNTYVTGSTIRLLREAKGLTQAELAGKLAVSAKTISKWETAKGLPDISLLEPLAAALGVSVLELMQGEPVVNRNRAANLLRSKLYVCPICGNVLHATGQAVVSCCGLNDNPRQLLAGRPEAITTAKSLPRPQPKRGWRQKVQSLWQSTTI